jgi:hypothetical protein
MHSKQITEEKELISQQVRNWNGSQLVLNNIVHRLSVLRNLYEQEEITNKNNNEKQIRPRQSPIVST